MGMTFYRIYECSECGYVFEGLSGMQDYGDMFEIRFISPMICKKCGNIENVVTGFGIDSDVTNCEKCGVKMESMEEDVVYECPKCHKKSLKCVNKDSVYSKGTIFLY